MLRLTQAPNLAIATLWADALAVEGIRYFGGQVLQSSMSRGLMVGSMFLMTNEVMKQRQKMSGDAFGLSDLL
jgi:hypothetical protein